MVEDQENVFYYLTVMNENYAHPGLRPGDAASIIKGMYLLQPTGDAGADGGSPESGKAGKDGGGAKDDRARVQLLGCGVILREVLAAADLLKSDWNVAADVWSVPSFTELRRDGMDCDRWNLLHPGEKPKVPFVTQQLEKHPGPVVASTDYMKIFSDQIRAFIPKGRAYVTLGTDGFGRSDFRAKLREHFEVNRHFVVLAALKTLAEEGKVPAAKVGEAIKRYALNPEKTNPARA
jgi:pyruvate dehydrogenase E1 component